MFWLAFQALLISVTGHGQLTFPPSRFNSTLRDPQCQHYGCMWFSQGCQIGCKKCTDKPSGDTCSEPGGSMSPTLNDSKYRTFDIVGFDHTHGVTPWRAPGYAPIGSPCGLAGGGNVSHPGNGATTGGQPGIQQGMDGRLLPEGPKTKWRKGSIQEVAWGITANHGGGYSYRLCAKTGDNNTNSVLTEDCFQRGHLDFVSEFSWIEYGGDKSNRTAISATRVREGTSPSGSMWTRNPIPACAGPTGGVGTPNCPAPQANFTPPLPGLFGYGSAACFAGSAGAGGNCTEAQTKYWEDKFNFNIVDQVQVPADLALGEYALSFRWDCEQTPQVWSQCADIVITPA